MVRHKWHVGPVGDNFHVRPLRQLWASTGRYCLVEELDSRVVAKTQERAFAVCTRSCPKTQVFGHSRSASACIPSRGTQFCGSNGALLRTAPPHDRSQNETATIITLFVSPHTKAKHARPERALPSQSRCGTDQAVQWISLQISRCCVLLCTFACIMLRFAGSGPFSVHTRNPALP